MDIAYRKSANIVSLTLEADHYTVPDQMVSKSDFPKLKKPDDAMQVTDPNTGETGYRVGIEVFHQLHCLNLLRMSTYPDHYKTISWSDTNDAPEKVREHLGTFNASSRWRAVLIVFRSLHRDPENQPNVPE
jgi:hypothetical protein